MNLLLVYHQLQIWPKKILVEPKAFEQVEWGLDYRYVNLVQKSTFCTIMIWSTFYPNPISSSSSMAYLHKCPLDYTLPYGRSNFQSDFFASLIADSDSLQKTAWRNYLSFSNVPKGSESNQTKTKKIEGKLVFSNFPDFEGVPIRISKKRTSWTEFGL